MSKPVKIISEEYRKQNEELHKINESYGTSGGVYRDLVRPVAQYGRKKILDFGCGKRTLSRTLGPAYSVTDYDPCIPGLDTPPVPHPVVVCTDVLEHIEPEFVDNVIAELRRLTLETLVVAVAMMPSSKTLPDGRNSHLSLHPADWWQARFNIHHFTAQSRKPDDKVINMCWWIMR